MNVMFKLYLHQNMKTLEKRIIESQWVSEATTHYHVIAPFFFHGRLYKEGEIVLFTKEQLESMKVTLSLNRYIEAGDAYDYNRKPII